jgi:hypothetical protein
VHASSWLSYKSLSEPWCMHLSLTEKHTISQTMVYTILLDRGSGYYLGNSMYQSSKKNLSCGDGTNLDYYGVMATTSDFSMATITLGTHYSMLFCQPSPPEALSVPCRRCVDSGGPGILSRPCLIMAWNSRCPGPKLL